MSSHSEPNPPSRRNEDFPKTNTIPGAWNLDEMVEDSFAADRGSTYHGIPAEGSAAFPVPTTGSEGQPDVTPDEELFTRRLDPNADEAHRMRL